MQVPQAREQMVMEQGHGEVMPEVPQRGRGELHPESADQRGRTDEDGGEDDDRQEVTRAPKAIERVRVHRGSIIAPMGRLFARDVHGPTIAWWQEEAPLDDALPPLEDDIDADVAIVGGGFTGLWTALELKRVRPATRVVLLEAVRCGDGASG